MPISRPRIAVAPSGVLDWAAQAIEAGGGDMVAPAEAAGLIWTSPGYDSEPGHTPADLSRLLREHSQIRWVQLPWAGVEPFNEAGVFDHQRLWTSAKGAYANPVAEHALALALAGIRHLAGYARETAWSAQAGTNLLGARVTILGAGGSARKLISLLEPFGCDITVIRRRPAPVEGAARVAGLDDRIAALREAGLVVVLLALTPDTENIISRAELDAMPGHAWLVNVARGRHVATDDLVAALGEGSIGGAALDVTEPEPLPAAHPLWRLPNCLITPHTANTVAMAEPLLAARIIDNVRRFAAGDELLGQVDPRLGY